MKIQINSIILILTLLITGSFAGDVHVGGSTDHHLAVTITDSDSAAKATAEDTVYVLFPSKGNQWYLSLILPTSTYTRGYNWEWEHASLMIEPNASTGLADAETDSMEIIIKPIIWDEYDDEFAVIESDSLWCTFQQDGVTSSSEFALDWDSGVEYLCALVDANGTPVFGGAVCGLQLIIKQILMEADEAGTGIYTVQPIIKK